jgi:CubicO group peptidase (beta-lactamase class C family)
MAKLFKTVLAVISLIIAIEQHPLRPSPEVEKSREIATALLDTYPGLSISLGIGDELYWQEGFGYADVDKKVKVNPNHQFRYYSLSKAITGLALMKLIEAGRLDIERPIMAYLPDLPSHYHDVKVKYVINHTAGIRHYKNGEWNKISKNHCKGPKEALSTFINDNLISPPGEQYTYSSFGYVLLSYLIEELSGQSYTEFVQQKIFAPLDISSIHLDQSAAIAHEVNYYAKWKPKKAKAKEAQTANNSCKFGGGGYVGTTEDMLKLFLAATNGDLFPTELTDQYFKEIPHKNGESTGYAFGIGDSYTQEGLRYHFHSGSARGASAALLIFPKQEGIDRPVVVVATGNLNDDRMNQSVARIASLFK